MHTYKPSIQKQRQENCESEAFVDSTDDPVSKISPSEFKTFHLGGKVFKS